MTKRDWSKAEPKREEGCRLCGSPAQLAHVIGRSRDERIGGTFVVDPDSIVPLCAAHHRAYDNKGCLDLMPYLTVGEQARAVLDAGGIENARQRISGREFRWEGSE